MCVCGRYVARCVYVARFVYVARWVSVARCVSVSSYVYVSSCVSVASCVYVTKQPLSPTPLCVMFSLYTDVQKVESLRGEKNHR